MSARPLAGLQTIKNAMRYSRIITNAVPRNPGKVFVTARKLIPVVLILVLLPAAVRAQSAPAPDPYHAHRDVEVGRFYMKRGDLDAAMNRFLDAIKLMPAYAEPLRLLAECYVKKGDKNAALKYYREYLKVFPTAPDAAKVEKKIEALSRETSGP